jgi:hypothetical protein
MSRKSTSSPVRREFNEHDAASIGVLIQLNRVTGDAMDRAISVMAGTDTASSTSGENDSTGVAKQLGQQSAKE